MSSEADEKPKLVVTEHSQRSLEYINEMDGYLPALETAPGDAALSQAKVFDLRPGQKVGVRHGIRVVWGTVLKYEPPMLYIADRYGKVHSFNLSRVVGLVQDLETVREKARRARGK
jgi:hypothetical protein